MKFYLQPVIFAFSFSLAPLVKAMPRPAAAPIPAPAAKRVPAKVVPAPPPRTFTTPEEATQCPLCVEDFDSTDLSFLPCPCGYRVCLFCYGRIKEECKSLCPGCRREYGSEPVEANQGSDSGALHGDTNSMGRTYSSSSALGIPGSGGPGARGDGTLSGAAGALAARAGQAVNRAGHAAASSTVARRGDSLGVSPVPRRGEDVPALPSGATWATQAGGRAEPLERTSSQQQPPAPAALVDTSAWPDLAAAAVPPPAPARPPREHHHHREEASPHGSNGNLSVMQRTQSGATSVTSMSHDPVVSPEQLGMQSGGGMAMPPHMAGSSYQTAQVATDVFGNQRSVNVVLPHPGSPPQDVYAEANQLQMSIDQAIRSGTMTAQQASAELLALLKSREGHAGRPLVAASRPPPGFAGVPPGMHQLNPAGLNPADSPVVANPPIGRYQPIGKPVGPPGSVHPHHQQQQQQAGVYPGAAPPGSNGRYPGSAAPKPPQTPGTYSLWSGVGPAIDLMNNTSGSGMTFAAWMPSDGHPGSMGGSASMGGMYGGSGLMSGGGAVMNKPPPPGFGPQPQAYNPPGALAGGGANDALGGAGAGPGPGQVDGASWFQSAFNFTSVNLSASARGPPPGMTAFRQQLGTGA